MTGRPRPRRRDAQGTGTAETFPAAEIEVTFTPVEPELTPAAARAVLALLLQARDQAGSAALDAGRRVQVPPVTRDDPCRCPRSGPRPRGR
jgi:hypothetical protein